MKRKSLNKRTLYENIMRNISREVKRSLNENRHKGSIDNYNDDLKIL